MRRRCPGMKKGVTYQSASGKPKRPESLLKLKEFCKSTQHTQQFSPSAFKLKINGCGFKNGKKKARHCPPGFLYKSESTKKLKHIEGWKGRKKQTVQENLLTGHLTGVRDVGCHESHSISGTACNSTVSQGFIPRVLRPGPCSVTDAGGRSLPRSGFVGRHDTERAGHQSYLEAEN